MSTYRVIADLAPLVDAASLESAQTRRTIDFAVRAVAEEGASRWREAAMDAKLRAEEKKEYADSIGWKMTGDMEGVVFATYRHAEEIETGRPERDLKENLRTSKKTRAAKSGPHKGQRYLIIPFRHNTPTSSGKGAHAPQMPQAIYTMAKQLGQSRVLAPGFKKPAGRLSASGHLVPQRSYQWGGRLPAGLAPKLKPHHRSDPYAGMVRMDTSSGRSKSSAYLTFRMMGEWSSGWIVGPQPGQHIAKGVAASLHGILTEAVDRAVSARS